MRVLSRLVHSECGEGKCESEVRVSVRKVRCGLKYGECVVRARCVTAGVW